MNIFLIPYTWSRHLQFGIWSALCSLIAWWFYLLVLTQGGMVWSSGWDAFVTNALLCTSVVFANIWGEGALRRWSMRRRLWKLALGVGISMGITLLVTWSWAGLSLMFLEDIGSVHHVVALKYRWGNFMGTGVAVAIGVMSTEKWRGQPKTFVLNYLLGGLFAGLTAGALWSISAYYWVQNLYWAGAILFVSFGFSFGWATRSIPDDLYVGWIRVLSGNRFGHRIPIDAKEKLPKERFVGAYPNGLDLFFPVESFVQPLHASVVHNPTKNTYTLRGLTQYHLKMVRMLEWAKLNYDPQSPVPMEVNLSNEDRVELGENVQVEFLILPREER